MRVCLDIEFQDAIVCILGGGKVALRKTKQFLEAGATIYIHSIQYEPEFNTLHINKVDKDTFIHTLAKAKLAIACTNNESVNKEFIQTARKHHVLAMSCNKNQEQDTFSTVTKRDKHLVLSCHTNGSFPVANQNIVNDWKARLEILETLRNKLQDHALCHDLVNLDDQHLCFFQEVFQTKQAIIYLLHGNSSLKARIQCQNLIQRSKAKFEEYTSTTFFLAKKYQDIDLETLCKLLQEFHIKPHFVFLFWQQGRYVMQGAQTINQFGFDHQHIQIDPNQFIKESETLIMHTKPTSKIQNAVLVSMLDSPFLRSQYPDARFVCCLDDTKVIERILYEVNSAL